MPHIALVALVLTIGAAAGADWLPRGSFSLPATAAVERDNSGSDQDRRTIEFLGRWCNDHDEVWIFGPDFLTHRQPGNIHRHRVRYKPHFHRMTVYVDGYPDVFRPSLDGSRMWLESSGLDPSMRGWQFWRCPDLHSFKLTTI